MKKYMYGLAFLIIAGLAMAALNAEIEGDFTINNSLGIGTNSPEALLHIYGGDSGVSSAHGGANELIMETGDYVGISMLTPNNRRGRIFFGDPENNDVGKFEYLHIDNSFRFTANAGERMIIGGNGKVGINQMTPLAGLHIESPSTSVKGIIVKGLAGQSANLQEWQDSSGTVLTAVDKAGNVGIGTSTPSQKLHVEGNLNVTGDIYHGGTIYAYSPVIIDSADDKSVICMKADDGKFVGLYISNQDSNYGFAIDETACDAKLVKITSRRDCETQKGNAWDYNENECISEGEYKIRSCSRTGRLWNSTGKNCYSKEDI